MEINEFWTSADIAKMIDHSLLNPVMTTDDIAGGCEIAKEYGVATVCVKPSELLLAASKLSGSGVLPTTVIGFPHGSNKTSVKVFEAKEAMIDGALELDMVLNIGRLLSGDYEYVENDIRAVTEAAHAQNVIVKVILENCYLTDEQIKTACGICEKAGADFVKTSTGYGTGGATIEDLTLMRASCSRRVRVKAAGGVRTLDKALEVRAAGASRFGATATKVIMDEAVARERGRNTVPWRLVQNKVTRYPGGREIDLFRGIPTAADDGRPEAWIGSDTRVWSAARGGNPDEGCAECILPDGARMYLYKAIEADPEGLLGRRHMEVNGPKLGFLVKLLDAAGQLSLQTHPTRAYAAEKFGSNYGKEESWYILGLRGDAAEPPYIYLGFKEGVTREAFEAGFEAQDAAALEALCHKIIVKPGDAYIVKAGVPHAAGPGCFLLEVQEPADITVGWRKLQIGGEPEREAHKQRLLGCYIYDGADADENLRRYKAAPRTIRSGAWGFEELIIGREQTEYFSFTKLYARAKTELTNTGFPQIMVVAEGSGILTFGGNAVNIKRGDEFFIPYAATGVCIAPSAVPARENAAKTDAVAAAAVAETGVAVVLCNPAQARYEPAE